VDVLQFELVDFDHKLVLCIYFQEPYAALAALSDACKAFVELGVHSLARNDSDCEIVEALVVLEPFLYQSA